MSKSADKRKSNGDRRRTLLHGPPTTSPDP
jgi:hypothetical protein